MELSIEEALRRFSQGGRHWRLVVDGPAVWTADRRERLVVPAVEGGRGRNRFLADLSGKRYVRVHLCGALGDGASMAEALQGYDRTEVLVLKHTVPERFDPAPVAAALPALQRLELKVRLGEAGAAALGAAFAGMPQLRTLLLERPAFGRAGFSALAAHLHEARGLKEFWVTHEVLRTSDLPLAAAAARPSALWHVKLTLSDTGPKALLAAVRFVCGHPMLQRAELYAYGGYGDNQLTTQAARAALDGRFDMCHLSWPGGSADLYAPIRRASLAYHAAAHSGLLPPELATAAALDAYDADRRVVFLAYDLLEAQGAGARAGKRRAPP